MKRLLTARLPPELIALLKREAKYEKTTVTEILIRALKRYFLG